MSNCTYALRVKKFKTKKASRVWKNSANLSSILCYYGQPSPLQKKKIHYNIYSQPSIEIRPLGYHFTNLSFLQLTPLHVRAKITSEVFASGNTSITMTAHCWFFDFVILQQPLVFRNYSCWIGVFIYIHINTFFVTETW